MSSSDRAGHGSPRGVIPGEALGGFTAWRPRLIGKPVAPPITQFNDLSQGEAGITSLRRAVPHLPSARTFTPGLPMMADAAPGGPAAGPTAGGGDDLDDEADWAADAALLAAATHPRTADEAWRDAVREELHDELHHAWRAQAEAEREQQVHDARQAGYQDGYRDGLAALDSFKESFANQVTSQVGQLLQAFDREIQALEQQIAEGVVRVATALAREVVRDELATRPELVAQVAQQAMGALLKTARHVTVALHPEDHVLVADACSEQLAALEAQIVARPSIARGGCLVESDVGSVDARITTRWAEAARRLGSPLPWHDAADGHPAGEA
jgi:flagellar assembly protein FliH